MKSLHFSFAAERNGQRGVSLVVVMLILIVVTLLGAGAAQMSMLGERMTRADRDRQIAFQAAEAALEDAYTDINGGSTNTQPIRSAYFANKSKQAFTTGCNTGATDQGLCLPSVSGQDVWYLIDFTDTSSNSKSVAFGTYSGRSSMAGTGSGIVPAQLPRYIIEVLTDKTPGTNSTSLVYRVTAVGFGPGPVATGGSKPNAQVMLQTEYRRPK